MTESLREQFIAFDERLAELGVKPCTKWWRDGIGAWLDRYEDPLAPVLALHACVGRGAAKSTALYKLALFFTLFGNFDVPAGERHFAVVLSRLKEEAGKGLDIIGAWLRLLAVPFRPSGDTIELIDDPSRGIRVVAASVAASSGWRAFFVGKDERSKWPSGGVEDLAAEEIDTSASAMTATHARAPEVAVGSAFGAFGSFFDAITAGNTPAQHVLGPAPTWVAAPHIKREDTERKERDPRRWAREYACEFQAGALSAFSTDEVDGAIEHPRHDGARLQRHVIIDASSGKKDSFTYGVIGWVVPPKAAEWRAYLHVYAAGEVSNEIAQREGASAVITRIAAVAREHGADTVHGDQRDSAFIKDAFNKEGLSFREHTWTAQSKPAAVERVRTWLREGTVAIPAEPSKFRAQMLSFDEKITPSGQFTFAARGSGHDDYPALLVTAAMAQLDGAFVAEEPDTSLRIGKGNGRSTLRHGAPRNPPIRIRSAA
jgi:hypothetical protein